MHRDQHFQERLILILFVNFPGYLTGCTLDSRGKIFLNLRAIKMWIIPVVEDRVVSKSVS